MTTRSLRTHKYFEVWKLGTIAHDLAIHLLSKHHDWPYLDTASLGTGITLRRHRGRRVPPGRARLRLSVR